jgi:DNA polymerase I-like protein with 3'-5' exonuclease and polymerase domains
MKAMVLINRDARLRELGWRMLLQIHDELILEGPEESKDEALGIQKTNKKPLVLFFANHLNISLNLRFQILQRNTALSLAWLKHSFDILFIL